MQRPWDLYFVLLATLCHFWYFHWDHEQKIWIKGGFNLYRLNRIYLDVSVLSFLGKSESIYIIPVIIRESFSIPWILTSVPESMHLLYRHFPYIYNCFWKFLLPRLTSVSHLHLSAALLGPRGPLVLPLVEPLAPTRKKKSCSWQGRMAKDLKKYMLSQ